MDNKFSMQLSAKQIFMAGVAAGVLVFAALGFVMVLAKGVDTSSWFTGSARVPSAPTQPADPSAQPPAGEAVGDVAPVTDQDHIRGNKNAKVTLIEYSDFQCPFCSRFHPTLVQLLNEYKNDVRWVYRHFPLSSIHPYAQKAAEASECASEQGKFWEMADTFFSTQDSWSSTGLDQAKMNSLAQQAGVKDIKKFETCVTSGKMAARVASDLASGEAAGVTGTPGSIVLGPNGEKELIPGALPYESVKQIVDSMLK
ncbi:MAG TPA: thioredoxin domain-containing protein [Candidatus Baltobacteraceae bacterium]|jgi:protein-disulfide isomerase|nr:thioredoxin domain-containing protein [Candidatus Baltobacteraceae bacterium]